MTTKSLMKTLRFIGMFVIFALASAFTAHKFYMSIYQLRFNADKSRLEITGRIFIDDLNECLSKYAKTATHVGESQQSKDDLAYLQRYMAEQLKIKVNGKPVTLTLVDTEIEETVVICYFRVDGVRHPRQLDVSNTALLACHSEQQNILQADVSGEKKNIVLKEGETSAHLVFP
jgi:hypothetical protein